MRRLASSAARQVGAQWPVLAALAAAFALAAGLLALGGHHPLDVLATWWAGAVGNPARISASFAEACPLLLCGLAAAVAFRAGVLNIGGEGQFVLGALAMIAVGTTWRPPGPGWLALLIGLGAAVAAGAAWALLADALARWRGVPVVLSTILLNFVALLLMAWLVERVLHDPTTTAPQTAMLADDVRLPVWRLGEGHAALVLHAGIALALLLVALQWLFERRTALGFELRVCGLGPEAAQANGLPLTRLRSLAMTISGGLAGLAGAIQTAGVIWFLSGNTRSYGYLGVAVALLGRLHPLGIALAALFFGMLDAGARLVERRLDIPRDLADALKGAIVLAVLVGGAYALRRHLQARRASEAA